DGDPNGSQSEEQPTWNAWTPAADQDKIMVFDATNTEADVGMSAEELTLAQVNTAWVDALTAAGLTPTEAGTLRSLIGQSRRYSTPGFSNEKAPDCDSSRELSTVVATPLK